MGCREQQLLDAKHQIRCEVEASLAQACRHVPACANLKLLGVRQTLMYLPGSTVVSSRLCVHGLTHSFVAFQRHMLMEEELARLRASAAGAQPALEESQERIKQMQKQIDFLEGGRSRPLRLRLLLSNVARGCALAITARRCDRGVAARISHRVT